MQHAVDEMNEEDLPAPPNCRRRRNRLRQHQRRSPLRSYPSILE